MASATAVGLAGRGWGRLQPLCAACRRRYLHASNNLAGANIPSASKAARSTRNAAARKLRQSSFDPRVGTQTDAARKSSFKVADRFGYLKCNLDTAERIVAELPKRKRLDGAGVLSLAKEYNVEVIALTAIARLLLRQDYSHELRQQGSILLAGCAEAGEPVAVVGITRIAVRRGETGRPHFQKFMPKLARLATKQNDPAASTVYAAVLEKRGQIQEAIQVLENALENGRSENTIDEEALNKVMRNTDDSSMLISDAYAELGRLYLDHMADEEKAMRAYQKGAFLADDPQAYHGLSQFEIDVSTEGKPVILEQWVEFETKAAASGHPEAQLELANFFAMSDDEARQQATADAFRIHQKAQKPDVSRFAGFSSIVGAIMNRLRYLLSFNPKARFPSTLSRNLNKMSWAMEWYALCVETPPPRVKPWLGMVRCLHRGGLVSDALAATAAVISKEQNNHIRDALSPEDIARLQKYLDTCDERYLDGTAAEAHEVKPPTQRGSSLRKLFG